MSDDQAWVIVPNTATWDVCGLLSQYGVRAYRASLSAAPAIPDEVLERMARAYCMALNGYVRESTIKYRIRAMRAALSALGGWE